MLIMDQCMFELLKIPDFTHFIQQFGYFGILLWFLTFDQVTPIPEEISLLLIGYLCAHHIFNPFLAGSLSLIGFVTVDIAYFHLSKTGSRLIKKKSKTGKSSFITSYKEKLRIHMPRTLIFLCFIPRMRMWGPILAGSMKLSFRKFLLFDGIGLSLFTIIYISIGYIFHASLASLMQKMKGWQYIIFIGALIIIAIIIMILIRKKYRQKRI